MEKPPQKIKVNVYCPKYSVSVWVLYSFREKGASLTLTLKNPESNLYPKIDVNPVFFIPGISTEAIRGTFVVYE